ncbi:MAG TPA: redoxin family protein [Candidatus Hydrogenedentes bacterium]|nr:redoxin family protein [Candidatus Hydrogenedentota bacterium]
MQTWFGRMNRGRVLLGILLLLGARAAVSVDPPAASTVPEPGGGTAGESNVPSSSPEEAPSEIFSALMQSVVDLDSLSFELLMRSTLTRGDQTRETVINGSVRMKGQDKIRYELKAGNEEVWLISDGTSQWVYLPPVKRYMKVEPTLSRSEFMSRAPGGPFEAITTWLADFLNGNLIILQQAKALKRLPDEPVGSEMCQVCEMVYERFTLRTYCTRETPRSIRRLEADMSADLKDEAHSGLNLKLLASVEITGWRPNANIADDLFAFTPPPDAKEEGKESGNLKVGEDVPDFSLSDAKGNTVRLSDFKGKKVVVLDFWASWCGPCRMAMPKVNAVANTMQNEPVAFYAVNLQETRDLAERFIKKNGITLEVLYDADGRVARDFGVQGIPFLVVIDANGKVAWIHNGYAENVDKTLTEAIRKALGKPVAGAS